MTSHNEPAQALAWALCEIRALLAGYLGSDHPGDPVVREAAHIAYALHNQALAVLEGQTFDPASALPGLAFVDQHLDGNVVERYRQATGLAAPAPRSPT